LTCPGFGAQQPLLNAFDPQTAAGQRHLEPQARARVLAWLSWLYRANVIPSLIFVEHGDQLVRRLEQGQLDWINCNATAIGRLRKALGPNLAVSVLSQGLDAKASHRRVAERFARLLLRGSVLLQIGVVLTQVANAIHGCWLSQRRRRCWFSTANPRLFTPCAFGLPIR
jgi:hypothetical protein